MEMIVFVFGNGYNAFRRLIGNPNLLYALFTKNEKPVYNSIFPGKNYEIVSVLPK